MKIKKINLLLVFISSIIYFSSPVNGFCGCSSMSVRTTGNSGAYPYYSGGTHALGPVNTIDLSQSGPYQIGYYFEVVAYLTPGSTASECTRGQLDKATERFLGVLYDYAGDGNWWVAPGPCPFSGNSYCSDDYTSEGDLEVNGNTTIRWLDFPGFIDPPLLKSTILNSDSVWSNSAFKATVTGTDGSVCSCKFKVSWKVNPSGTVLNPIIYGISCGGGNGGYGCAGPAWQGCRMK
jgi:hypothetical protein